MTSSPDSSAPAADLVGAERETVVGLDLSLTSTGFACIGNAKVPGWLARFEPTKLRGLDRLRAIVDWAAHELHPANPTLICIEGPSYGSQGAMQHERGGLWWMAVDRLDEFDYKLAVIPPASLKLYATGKGNAKKDLVMSAACRRFPDWPVEGNDEADALWLAAMGADHLGCPPVAMPAANRAALNKVPWPEPWPEMDAA